MRSGWHSIGFVALLGLATVSARGEEGAASPDPVGGLSGAKRDYDAVQAAGAPVEQQTLAVPSVPTLELKPEELRLLPGAMLPEWLERRRRAKEQLTRPKASNNWLVDALQSPSATSRDPRALSVGANEASLEKSGATTAGERWLAERRQLDAEKEQAKDAIRAQAEQVAWREGVVNPLADFMAQWMSPRDFELLQPSKDPASAASSMGEDGPRAVAGGPHRYDALPPGGPAATNPYLAPLDVASVIEPPAVAPAPELQPTPPGSAPLDSSANAEPAARSETPAEQFKRAHDDEKYFKPLKRF